MKYPTTDQTEGAAARRATPSFSLTARPLAFAKLFAAYPRLGARECALKAGYGLRGARARGNELLRDPRVIRAIIHFSARAFNHATAEARQNLTRLAIKEGRLWNRFDRRTFDRLIAKLKVLETHMKRVEKIYIREQDFLVTQNISSAIHANNSTQKFQS